jgi:hypothetical protein
MLTNQIYTLLKVACGSTYRGPRELGAGRGEVYAVIFNGHDYLQEHSIPYSTAE